ncbi:hypothetical protein PPACK8108_LOCUS8111, partial [Phakopsora pachyrhizi]
MRTLPPFLIVLGFGTFLFSLNYHLASTSIQVLQPSSSTSQQPFFQYKNPTNVYPTSLNLNHFNTPPHLFRNKSNQRSTK